MIPEYIEQELKKHIFRKYPRLEQDIHFHTLLTFEIYGGFYTYVFRESALEKKKYEKKSWRFQMFFQERRDCITFLFRITATAAEQRSEAAWAD